MYAPLRFKPIESLVSDSAFSHDALNLRKNIWLHCLVNGVILRGKRIKPADPP